MGFCGTKDIASIFYIMHCSVSLVMMLMLITIQVRKIFTFGMVKYTLWNDSRRRIPRKRYQRNELIKGYMSLHLDSPRSGKAIKGAHMEV